MQLVTCDSFSYVAINGLFLRLNQNPIKLAWFLFFRSRSLRLRSTFKTKKLISTIKTLIFYQLGLRKVKVLKRFGFCCHLIFRVHGGYRAFDFKHKTVTKILDAGSSQKEVKAEIDSVCKAGQLDFAPCIISWNTAQNWYEEEYVDGVIGYSFARSDAHAISKRFSGEIIRCLEKMILLDTPIRVTVGKVVNQCSKFWAKDRLSTTMLAAEQTDSFYEFVHQTISKLSRRAEQPIYLIFSHGDFSLQNILIIKNKLKVLDWESISNRSVLYDLHNFFLTELYYNRASKFLVNDVRNAIKTLQSNLTLSNSEIFCNLIELAEIYRLLYYIERICMLVQRGLNNKILEVITRSVNTFSKYERAIMDQQ